MEATVSFSPLTRRVLRVLWIAVKLALVVQLGRWGHPFIYQGF
jgi:hypothetical protein